MHRSASLALGRRRAGNRILLPTLARKARATTGSAKEEEEKKQDDAYMASLIDSAASASPLPSSISVPTTEPTALIPTVVKDTGRYGCEHGARLCKVRGTCCTSFYTCRNCHDRNSDHELLRRNIVDMVCMRCSDEHGTARVQPVSNQCVDCHSMMSKHFCEVCRIFSDNTPDEAPFFHCTSCELSGVESGVGYCVADSECPHGRPNADERAKREKEKQKQDQAKMKEATRAMKKSEEQHAKKTNATKPTDQPPKPEAKPSDPAAPAADAAASSDAPATSTRPRMSMRSPLHPHPLYVLVPCDESAESDETLKDPLERCSDCNIELDTHAHAVCERDECEYGICANCIEEQIRDVGREQVITIEQFVQTTPQGDWVQQWVDGAHTFKLMTIDTTKEVPEVVASAGDVAASDVDPSSEPARPPTAPPLVPPEPEPVPADGRPSCDLNLNRTNWLGESAESAKRLFQDRLGGMHRLAYRMSQLPWHIIFKRANEREGLTHEVSHEREERRRKIVAIPSALRAHLPSNDGTPPPDLYLPQHHEHPLQFFASRYQGVYECNLCHTNSSEGAYAYACNQCSYDAHLSCILPHTTTSNLVTPSIRAAAIDLTAPLTTPLHHHNLEFFTHRYYGGMSCNVCGQFGSGAAFACNECSWDAHLTCALYPKLTELWKADLAANNHGGAASSDWDRIETDLQTLFLLAHSLIDHDQKLTVGAQQAAFIESKYMWNETEVQWKCSRVGCISNVSDRSTIDGMAVYRCTDCCTNLCLECAAAMHAHGHVRIVNAGSEVDASQVEQWCLGDGVTPAIHIDDINAVLDADEEKTGLMIAIERRDLKQAVWLLQSGSEVHRKDADGQNALHYAVLTADPQFVQLVLGYRPKIIYGSDEESSDEDEEDDEEDDEDEDDEDGEDGEEDEEDEEDGEDETADADKPPDGAAETNNAEDDSDRISGRVLPPEPDRPTDYDFVNCETAEDDPKTRPLGIAAAAGNLPIVKLLVQAEAVLEGSLWLAVANGHTEVTRFLLRSGAPIDDKGCDSKGFTSTALHQACRVGSIEIVMLLLSYGADVRIEDDESHTCLFQAVTCKHERPDILAALLLHFKQPAQKSKTRQVQLKHTPPFVSQTQSALFDEHATALVERTGYGSHLQCMMPYTSLVADACKTRTYPSLMHEAACRGHITCVDVILREIAKSIYSKSAAAPATNARVWTSKEVSNAVAAQESISSAATMVAKGQRFQFEHLYSKSRSQIMNHAPVLMLLQYPHIHYALDGGADALTMVAFSLDYLGCFPSTSSDVRCEGPPASVLDRATSKDAASRYGFTVLHAACASKTCTRALVQMLLLRGASPITIAESRKELSAAAVKPGKALHPLSLASRSASTQADLNARTPLCLLLRNQDIPLSEKLEICHDLALLVARMYEDMREIDVHSLPPAERTTHHENLALLHLFAKQLSSDDKTVSTAWRTIGTMWNSFVPECIPSASAEQIVSAITDPRISPAVQRQLLFDSQLSQHIVMSLLPLLAERRQLALLEMLAENESTKFVHTNSTRDHLSIVSVLSCAGSAEGVKAILTRLPSPALTNTCDALGRAPIKIALQTWMGIDDAAAHAQTVIRRAVQQYLQSRSPPAGMTPDQLDEFLSMHRASLLADLSALPIATLIVLHTEYEELKMIVSGQKSVDLLAHTPHALDSEWGQTLRFNLRPKAPPQLCPVRFCARPIIAYCPPCARYLCSACAKAAHAALASPHVMIPIRDLKEAYLLKFRALDSLLRTARAVTTVTADGVRKLSPTTNQQCQRHKVLQLLLSAAGKFDMRDVAAAVRHWSIDLLNFRTRPLKLEEESIEKAVELVDQEDTEVHMSDVSSDPAPPPTKSEFSSALIGNRSVLHLAAVQQNTDLIDSLMQLFLRPKPAMKLINAHRPFQYWQILLWGDVRSGLRVDGVRFYHHDIQIEAECTNATGERVVFPYTDSSPSFRASDGQSLLYCTFPYPLLLTHYELVIDPAADPRLAPQQWQLAASNDDNATAHRPDTRWSVVRRHTAAEITDAEEQARRMRPQSARGPPANKPQPTEVTISSALSDRLPIVNHAHSSHDTSDVVEAGFLYYRWLFSATWGQAFQLELDHVRFFRGGKVLEPMEEGRSHDFLTYPRDESLRTPIKLNTFYQQGARCTSVPYPERGGRTRAIALYKFAQPVKVTDYALIAPSDVNSAPNSWRLYATNDAAVAENYIWTREVDEDSPQDQPWVLLDEQDDVPYPAPQSHIVDVSLLRRGKDSADGSSSGGVDSVAAAASLVAYQYFRLDVYSIFCDEFTSTICLQGAKLRNTHGDVVTPTSWQNPRGRLSDDASSEPQNLSHLDNDACWFDISIGSIGTSELIACFDKPVQLHSYQFARPLDTDRTWREPRAWTLAGSNDKHNWQPIQTMTDAKVSQLFKPTHADLEVLKEEAAAEAKLHEVLHPLETRTLTVTDHGHPLQLYSNHFRTFFCDICRENDCTGFSYSCQACWVDAHPHCAWKNRSSDAPKEATLTEEEFKEKMRLFQAKDDAEVESRRLEELRLRGKVFTTTEHTCVLKLFTADERLGFGCDICKQPDDGSGLTFACESCNWDAHPACAWSHRNVNVVADDTMTEDEFKAELVRKPLAAEMAEIERKEAMWSKPVFIQREHVIEAKRLQSLGMSEDAVAHALGSTAQASTGGVVSFIRSKSTEAALNPWLQRLFPDGSVGTPETVMQACTHGLILPTADTTTHKEHHVDDEDDSADVVDDVGVKDEKTRRRIAAERALFRLVRNSPRALVQSLCKLFDPDDAGLTPRDYALTLPVSRTLRKWERILRLSPVGIDAIVVFDQPQLIDSDVFEQFFRSMGARAWNALTCARQEDVVVDSKEQVRRRMRKLAHAIEDMGLAVNIYDSDETSRLAQVEDHDTDPTAVLLVTAPYARLLLECSSRALQDDPQYDSQRRLASDWCLPADMQEALSPARTPFTTAQRQALVMRILSGLGTDVDALSTLQHHKAVQDAIEAEADAAAAAEPDLTQERPTLTDDEAMSAAEEAGKNRRAAWTSLVRRLGASLKSAAAATPAKQPAMLGLMALAKKVKLGKAAPAEAATEAATAPPAIVLGSDVIHGQADVNRVEHQFAQMKAQQAAESVQIRIHPESKDGDDTVADATHLSVPAGALSSRPPTATPALVGTDSVDRVISQSASLNVLQMVARDEIRAVSLMHSQDEKERLEHAWRHLRVSEEEWAFFQVAQAGRRAIERADWEADAEKEEEEEHTNTALSFTPPKEGAPSHFSLLVQPFTHSAFRFSLREGESIVDSFFSLSLLRSYAGDRVAFFFAFMCYTLVWQFILFLPGLGLTLLSYFSSSNPALPWNSVFVMVWSTVFIDRWHRKSSELAYKYGTLGFEDTEACRPQFRGWRVKLTPEQMATKEHEYDTETTRRITAYEKARREYAAAGNLRFLPTLKPRQWNPAALLMPKPLFRFEQFVQETEAGVVPITCRLESGTRPVPLPWYRHLLRLFQCRCRRSRPTQPVTIIVAERINPITGEKEDFFPSSIFYLKLAATSILMLVQLGIVVYINLLILDLKSQYFQDPNDTSRMATYWPTFIGVLTGVTMKVLHTLYLIQAEAVLLWENHRTNTSHSNAKIIKTFCFAFVNSYFSLFYIALDADPSTAANDLATQLVSVMISRTATGIAFEDVLPYLVFRFMKRKLENAAAAEERAYANSKKSPAAVADSSTMHIRDETTPNASPPSPSMQSPVPSPSPLSSPTGATAATVPLLGPRRGSHTSKIAPEPVQAGRAAAVDTDSNAQHQESKVAWAESSQAEAGALPPRKPVPVSDRAGQASQPGVESPSSLVADDPLLPNFNASPSDASASPLAAADSTASDSAVADSAASPLSYRVGAAPSLKEIHQLAELEIQRPASPELLDNYLEIITQIGYVTCFSAVFPAAPLLVIGSLGLIGHGLLYKYLHISQRPMQERAADIGAWVSVLTFLSFASIITNCVLIFHSSHQWEAYSAGYSRQTCMLAFALFLFIAKVVLMELIPDQAGWVTTKLLATKYKQDKLHANEVTHAQAADAVKIERDFMRRQLDKQQQQQQQEAAAAATAATKKKNN